MIRRSVTFSVSLTVLLATTCFGSVCSEDPLRGVSSTFIFNEFMQLDTDSPQNLHTGVDIGATTGATVYAPLPTGKSFYVLRKTSDYVWAQALEAQGTDNPAFEPIGNPNDPVGPTNALLGCFQA